MMAPFSKVPPQTPTVASGKAQTKLDLRTMDRALLISETAPAARNSDVWALKKSKGPSSSLRRSCAFVLSLIPSLCFRIWATDVYRDSRSAPGPASGYRDRAIIEVESPATRPRRQSIKRNREPAPLDDVHVTPSFLGALGLPPRGKLDVNREDERAARLSSSSIRSLESIASNEVDPGTPSTLLAQKMIFSPEVSGAPTQARERSAGGSSFLFPEEIPSTLPETEQ